jgi:hypothetical protein
LLSHINHFVSKLFCILNHGNRGTVSYVTYICCDVRRKFAENILICFINYGIIFRFKTVYNIKNRHKMGARIIGAHAYVVMTCLAVVQV